MPRRTEQEAVELVRGAGQWSPARVERGLSSLHRGLRRRRTIRLTAAAALVLLVAGAGVVLRGASSDVGPITSTLRLEDGSQIISHADTRFAVREVTTNKVLVGLESGFIDVEVTPRPEREFIIEAGQIRVVVLGTRFEVDRGRESTRVRVLRGHVRVVATEGVSEQVDLLAGDERSFAVKEPQASAPPVTPRAGPTAPAPSTPSTPSTTKKTAGAAKTTAPAATGMETGDWRPLAQRGVYDDAYKALAAQEVPDKVDDLLLASDAARMSGHPKDAVVFLERVVRNHPTDERAAMAGFTRGRILSELNRYAEAASAFEQALALGAEGSLRENALARAVEAHHHAGNTELARQQARAYLAQYPHGRWESLVRASGALDE